MTDRHVILRVALLFSALIADKAAAGIYRVVPTDIMVEPGAMTQVIVEVETEAGDNTVNRGYFSFSVDLAFSGNAGVLGSNVSNVAINLGAFDDHQNASTGAPIGSTYGDVAGVTTDILRPSFGWHVGDIIQLFSFDLTIPAGATNGDTILISPSEGFLGNRIVSGNFDPVAPQNYAPSTLTVVPEPTSAFLLIVSLASVPLRWTWVRMKYKPKPNNKPLIGPLLHVRRSSRKLYTVCWGLVLMDSCRKRSALRLWAPRTPPPHPYRPL